MMNSLLMLPTEVLETILGFLDMQSISSLSQTCWHLYNIQDSDKVWKSAFYNRCIQLTGAGPRMELDAERVRSELSWRQLTARRCAIGALLSRSLDAMGGQYYSVGGLPDPAMQELQVLVDEHGAQHVQDELLLILESEYTHPNEDISLRYYARMLYRELYRERRLLPLLRDSTRQSVQHLTLAKALHLLMGWVSPDKWSWDESEVTRHYLKMAGLVLTQLRNTHPDHPLAAWTDCKPDLSGVTLWPDEHVPAVLDAVNTVLFEQLALLGDNSGQQQLGYQPLFHRVFCYHDPRSAPAIMSALYSGVAGMLGVSLQLVQCPATYFLRWNTSDNCDRVYIDMMRRGRRQNYEELTNSPYMRIQNLGWSWFEPIPERELLQRLVGDVTHWRRAHHWTDSDLLSLDALAVWAVNDGRLTLLTLYSLSEIYGGCRPLYAVKLIQEFMSSRGSSLTDDERDGLLDSVKLMKQRYEQILQELKHHQESLCLLRNTASVQRRFRVGDIVHHKKYNYEAVITGWTATCQAPKSWVDQMGVHTLLRGCRQPFFHLLADDNSNRYAADDNLELSTNPQPILHREVGRYFVRFDRHRYAPVPTLAARYPDPSDDDGDAAEDLTGEARDSWWETDLDVLGA